MQVQALNLDLDTVLSPTHTLADDPRCNVFVRVFPKWPQWGSCNEPDLESDSEASLSSNGASHEPLGYDLSSLTTGGLMNHAQIQSALVKFDNLYEELKDHRQLLLSFCELANDGPAKSVRLGPFAMVDVEGVLLPKLTAFHVFWSTVVEWDRNVDRHMQIHPDLVRVQDVLQQAQAALCAVESCPDLHQNLLQERVGSLCDLLQPLQQIQDIITMFPEIQETDNKQVEVQMLEKNLARRTAMGNNKVCSRTSQPSLCSSHQGVWKHLFELTPIPAFSSEISFVDAIKTSNTLRSIIRTGILYRSEEISKHHKKSLQAHTGTMSHVS